MLKPVLAMLMIGGIAAWGQAQNDPADGTASVDHAAAYYYYVIAHMYAEKAAASGGRNEEYINKAIENLKAALKADPSIPLTTDELSGIYKKRPVTLTRPPAPSPSSK